MYYKTEIDNNFCVDYIFYVLVFIYGIKGFRKGAVSAVFSLFANGIAIFVAYKSCQGFSTVLENFEFFNSSIPKFIQNNLNKLFPGEYSTSQQVLDVISVSQIGIIFNVFIKKLISGIDFDGTLTVGEIFGTSIAHLLIKIISFIIIYISILIILKLFKIILNKIIKLLNLKITNRIFGVIFGIIEGIFFFSVLFVILTLVANFTLNEGLNNFLNEGVVSNKIYNLFLEKIINLFY